jgi:hypothetical protein
MLINMRRYWYSVARNDSDPAYHQAKISSILFKHNANQYKRPHTAIDKDMIDADSHLLRDNHNSFYQTYLTIALLLSHSAARA